MNRACAAVAAIALTLFTSGPSTGAEPAYPNKPIRFIVPVPPGGGSDFFARTIGTKLSEAVQQPVVIDNRAGASGNLGAEIVARGVADGYTIIILTIGLATNPAIYKKLPFDAINDFAPVTLVAAVPHLLVVNPKVPAKSVKELIALAKASPGKLNYASAGVGTPFHLAPELFKVQTGTNIVHVPYKGGGPAIADVIGGQIDLAFGNLVAVLPHVRAGTLRALGITTAKRSPAAADIPTIAEAGVPGYDFAAWFGIFSAARTPRIIVGRLNTEIVRALESPATKERLTNSGADVTTSTPEALADYLKSETAKWTRVLKEAGIKPE
jgi:tripartite-type tricarboxylate transporter receptor subunit TctC